MASPDSGFQASDASVASAVIMVDPLVPLTLLEAVRDVDRPEGAHEAEYVPELLNKRLGMTDTVFAQIRRYHDAVQRRQRISADEVSALTRLIARRPDAGEVFRIAGTAAARTAYGRIAALWRGFLRTFPRMITRRPARRQVRKLEGRYFSVGVDPAYHDAGIEELCRLLGIGS